MINAAMARNIAGVLANPSNKMMEKMAEGQGGLGTAMRQVMEKQQVQNSPAPPPLTAKEQELIGFFEKGAAVDPRVMNYGLASLAQKRKDQVMQGSPTGSLANKPPVGVAALGNRQDIAEKLAAMGRYDDDEIAHVAEGEVIVPAPIMKYYPEIKEQIFTIIRNEGLDPNEFVVGDEMVARNPSTGMQEFGWLSKAWKSVKKIVKEAAPYIAAAVGLYFLGPAGAGMYGTGTSTAAGAQAAAAAKAAGASAAAQAAAAKAASATAFSALSTTGQIAATAKAAAGFAAANPATAGFIAGTTTGIAKGDNLKDSLKLGLKAGAVTGTLGNVFGTEGLANFASNPATSGGSFMAPGQQGIQNILAKPQPLTGPGGSIPKQSAFKSLPGKISKFATSPGALGKTVDYAALGLIGAGLLGKEEEMVDEPYEYEPTREGQAFGGLFYDPATGTYGDAPSTINVIRGPIQRANDGGAIMGPGTGTSDSIPAMLSDGEFVMTAKAVRAMGGGDREKGAAKMYQLMNRLEGKA